MNLDIEIENIKIATSIQDNYTDRPTIVFLHDSFGCIELWRDFPEKLGKAAQCNILVYDRQGYGMSDPFSTKRTRDYMEIEADTLIKLLNKCKINNAILFGHSDGGTIALLAAAKYPEKISGVITEGAHVFVEEITLDGIRQNIENYNKTNLKEKLEKYHGKKAEALFSAWAGIWLNEEYHDWNIEHLLPNIQCPTLIIQGKDDEFGSAKQVDAIVTQVTGDSTKFMISNIGHTPHKETTEVTLKKTAEFIKVL